MQSRTSGYFIFNYLVGILVAGCSSIATGQGDSATPVDSAADVTSDAVQPLASPGDSLPCEVATLLERDCVGCHYTGSYIAPSSLLSRADLMRPSTTDPSRTVAQVSVQRMMDTTSPMPPAPAPAETATAIAAFQQWIDSGTPMGSCMLPDPLADPAMCPSNAFWTQGDHGSVDMHPGQACIACHTSMGRGPRPNVAGTIFPTGHAPDNCDAWPAGSPIPSTVDIQITDSRGQVSHVIPNASGNFALIALGFTPPYTANVVYMGRSRRMTTPQTDGDCNGCHTQSGANSAPGRITIP